MAKVMQEIARWDDDRGYKGEDGSTLKREYGVLLGDQIRTGTWVFRNNNGDVIDWGTHRFDLAEAHDLELQPI